MKFPLIAASLLAGTLAPCGAQAAEFNNLVTDQSTLAFTFRQMNVPVEGRFMKFNIQLSFDPSQPELAKASLDIDLASIDAGSDEANDEVAGAQWFDTKRHPVARFVAAAMHALGDNRYRIDGQLTIKGRTRDVTAPATFQTQGGLGVLDGSLVIERADFAIGEGPWADFSTVANEIPVRFRFVVSTSPRK